MLPEAERTLMFAKLFRGDLGSTQVWFDARVLERYRQQNGVRVIRTNSAGRIRSQAWSLDFGIAGDDGLIHAAAGDLSQRLPESEREHWRDHAEGLPLSRNFVLMRLGGGACIDDGEVRDWV